MNRRRQRNSNRSCAKRTRRFRRDCPINKTTEYTYNGNNNVLTVKADLPGGAYETTGYVYGVSTATGSGLNSNNVLAATQYPDKTTGNPSSSQQETYTVNGLGEPLTMQDRNGNVHAFGYDVLGRLTSDAVTTFGAGVDGTVQMLATAYNTGGRPYLYTSYSSPTGGSIVNQVQDVYNGLGQLDDGIPIDLRRREHQHDAERPVRLHANGQRRQQ